VLELVFHMRGRSACAMAPEPAVSAGLCMTQVYDKTAATLNKLLSGVEAARSGAAKVSVVVVR
jgi:hypothetical protein